MSVRLTGALVAALALLAALPAVAAADLSRSAQRVYDDYRTDAAIRPCDHSIKLYRRTLREITPDVEEETPAFRPAVEAALREREKGAGSCEAPGDDQQDEETPGGTGAGAQPAPPAQNPAPAKPAPAQPAQPNAGAAPAQPEGAATPEPTPTATVVPAGPVTSSAPVPAATPTLVDRPHEGTPVGLWIALGLLALALLALLLALLAGRFGWGEERLAGARHAWGEAAYRAGGTWGDFVDWLRPRRT